MEESSAGRLSNKHWWDVVGGKEENNNCARMRVSFDWSR
jgi:hypothetical protein